jgi:hypothetical protein
MPLKPEADDAASSMVPRLIKNLPDDEAVLLKDTPYAMRLAAWLHNHHITVEFEQGARRLGDDPRFIQLDTRKDVPEEMGKAIMTRLGPKVTFGELSLNERHTLECASWQRASNVWVRHLVGYSVYTDDFRQRWDVLVRAT